jgi:soluble lytic murein transglycosylase-like protein
VTRTRFGIALLALLVVATTALALAAPKAGAATLSDQLRSSRNDLRRAELRLDAAQAALAAAMLAHQRRGVGVLIREVDMAEHAVRFWKAVIRDLLAKQARQATASADGSGGWRPVIDRVAKKYGVSADGLYRLMMMESGGKVQAVGSGRYYGLFQYALVTWKDDWNPFRARSVFDGSAQIEATALAVKKGMGRALWGNTYPAAF